MANFSHDLLVIGGGPGGYVAAIRASQCGLRVALIERELLGGICLNWGCIPTKALLRAADVWRGLGELGEFGLSAEKLSFDMAAVVARSRSVAKRLNEGVDVLLRKNGVEVCYGFASLRGEGLVSVACCNDKKDKSKQGKQGKQGKNGKNGKVEREFRAEHIVIATGARAREVSGMEIDGKTIWGYREAMLATKLPSSLVIVGGGAIGIEFASYFASFGVEVTVVEAQSRILPIEDEEIAGMLQASLAKRGIGFRLGKRVEKVEKNASGCELTFAGNSKIRAEKLLSAVGVIGNVEGLGLEDLGVEYAKGSGVIKVDGYGRTTKPGIYAIGDVAGAPQLAHKASHEGIACVESISGLEGVTPIEKSHIPSCVYSTPQVASVGLSEEVARGCGDYDKVRVGRFPLSSNGKAIAIGEVEGMVKVVFDDSTGGFLGAQLIGSEVTEMVQGFALALTLESTEAELMRAVFPHPTISETMQESVFAAYDRPLHVPPSG